MGFDHIGLTKQFLFDGVAICLAFLNTVMYTVTVGVVYFATLVSGSSYDQMQSKKKCGDWRSLSSSFCEASQWPRLIPWASVENIISSSHESIVDCQLLSTESERSLCDLVYGDPWFTNNRS